MTTRNIERNRVFDPKNPIARSTNYINSGCIGMISNPRFIVLIKLNQAANKY
ncbi:MULTISPECIES: hypothetical protein [unclassified Microcoleus]|uniref:hypothetical protein n=1 Tax=unclassified Microcoleus TaxID=2642155 RepID=UPI002FD4B7F2